MTLTDKLTLLRSLCGGARASRGPLYANIDVTHHCNLHCAYCRWHSPLLSEPFLDHSIEKNLSPDLFRGFCEELRSMGTRRLLFVGAGEPLLHPHLDGLIKTAQNHNLRVTLYSNGTLLNESLAPSLIDSRLDTLRVTLGDSTAERFEQKHPNVKPGAFQRILDGLSHLSLLKKQLKVDHPRLELGVPIDRHTLHHLDPMVEIAGRTGCDGIFFSVVLDFGESSLESFCLTPEEIPIVRRLLKQMRGKLGRLALRHNIGEVLLRYTMGREVWEQTPCYAPWFYTFLRTDGRILVCQRSEEPLGDLNRNSFEAIWNNADYSRVRDTSLSSQTPLHDCSFCPHAINNYRIHRFFRFLLPLLRLRGR